MSEDHSGAVLICGPPNGLKVDGSVILTAHCGCEVVVAPSGMKLLDEGARAYCVRHGVELARKHNLAPKAQGEALSEIEDTFGVGMRDQVEALMRDFGIERT